MPVKQYTLDQSPLYKLSNRKRLAMLLGTTPGNLQRLASNADSLYSEFAVPKKTGGTRDVENPGQELKFIQRKLANFLCRIAAPDYLFCPVKGRCYVKNAAQHCGQRIIRCLDIRKYFPSTPSRRVYWFFHKIMKCERDIAAMLTKIATFNGHLPTGSPLSPIMAYFAYYDTWEEIAQICRKHSYRLTVYIDDVTISGMEMSPKVIWRIKEIIHGSGLRYHKEKKFVDCPAEITGVIVRGDSISAPNRQLLKLYQARTALRSATDDSEIERLQASKRGLHSQIAQIDVA